jgi:CheY-like chemotaxis protein
VNTDDGMSGSRFVIALPVAQGAVDVVHHAVSTRPSGICDRLRVLVIDDDRELARALADELQREHDVVIVNGADEALELFETRFFDVVLCDLRMPGISGEVLYERVRQADPGRAERFIFMTGVGFGADVESFLSRAGRPFLEKPFSMEEVLDVILSVALQRSRAA